MSPYVNLGLRAPTEDDAKAAAIAALADGLTLVAQDEIGTWQWVPSGLNHCFIPIGSVVITPGVYDPDTGAEITPPVIDDGWHANLAVRSEMTDEVRAAILLHGAAHGVTLDVDTKRVFAT
ncbi:MAG: hypothetical protein JJ902_05480 [Roseibium sp.]|nr:hypothetical protein [Roseibium sp.]